MFSICLHGLYTCNLFLLISFFLALSVCLSSPTREGKENRKKKKKNKKKRGFSLINQRFITERIMEKKIIDFILVPSGLLVMLAYHIWLFYRILKHPTKTVVGVNAINRRFWVQAMMEVQKDIPSLYNTNPFSFFVSYIHTDVIYIYIYIYIFT